MVTGTPVLLLSLFSPFFRLNLVCCSFSHFLTFSFTSVICISKLPIHRGTLVYGSADGGVVIKDSPHVEGMMKTACKTLNLKGAWCMCVHALKGAMILCLSLSLFIPLCLSLSHLSLSLLGHLVRERSTSAASMSLCFLSLLHFFYRSLLSLTPTL